MNWSRSVNKYLVKFGHFINLYSLIKYGKIAMGICWPIHSAWLMLQDRCENFGANTTDYRFSSCYFSQLKIVLVNLVCIHIYVWSAQKQTESLLAKKLYFTEHASYTYTGNLNHLHTTVLINISSLVCESRQLRRLKQKI